MKELTERLVKEFADKDYAHAYMDSHQSTRLATQIKVLREQRGLTQKQLSEMSKMKQERISALEDVDYDSWTIATLRKLAYAFDTTLHVSFSPFSKEIEDISRFSREYLQVKDRESDLKDFSTTEFYSPAREWTDELIRAWQNIQHIDTKTIDKQQIVFNKEAINSFCLENDENVANDNSYQNAA